jgi:putative two-component system response regulator
VSFPLLPRVRIVVEDRRSASGALLAAARFIRRNPARSPCFRVLSRSAVWGAVLMDPPALELDELGRFRRTRRASSSHCCSSCFASWASATPLFQSRLAHASYTAGPPWNGRNPGGRSHCQRGGAETHEMMSRSFRNARILIVDDEAANIEILQRILSRGGFGRIETTTDSREAASLYVQHRPDLILLDLHMPHLDGLQVMDQLNEIAEASYLPILILSGDLTPEARREALSRGAKDFVNKPFQPDELLLRIKTLLETRLLYIQIQSQNQLLEAKVRERTRELVRRRSRSSSGSPSPPSSATTTPASTRIASARCRRCWPGSWRSADTQVSLIRRAAELHDVGKIGVPDTILLKMGKLTPEEFEIVKTHTVIGARILSGGKFPLLRLAEEIAFSHHERWTAKATPTCAAWTSRWRDGSSPWPTSSTRSPSSGPTSRPGRSPTRSGKSTASAGASSIRTWSTRSSA